MYMSQAEAKFLAQFIATETKDLRERIEKLEASGHEEMENYRMALAYISKQSTDQQSRELAETALSHTRPHRETPTASSPAGSALSQRLPE